jgi:hypothetical protein
MSWRRDLAGRAGRALVSRAIDTVASPPERVKHHYLVDPDWRRVEDGHAARLDARTTIEVARPVGRWRRVDPRLPDDGWRAPWKAVGLGLWAGAVGVAWWIGTSRGRGPLRMLASSDDEAF